MNRAATLPMNHPFNTSETREILNPTSRVSSSLVEPHSNTKPASSLSEDNAELVENKNPVLYDFSTLPDDAWEVIAEQLICIDGKAVAMLSATHPTLRNNQAIKASLIELACAKRMTNLRRHVSHRSWTNYPFERDFLNESVSKLLLLDSRYRRIPLVKLIHLSNYDDLEDTENITSTIHEFAFSELIKCDDKDKSEVLQPLFDSLKYHDEFSRTPFFEKLLAIVKTHELPFKDKLYATLSHAMLSLREDDARLLYDDVKKLILSLPDSLLILPLSHFVRVLSKLDKEKASEELIFFRNLVDLENKPDSIYILHGLLRAPQRFSKDEQQQLLLDANSAIERSVSVNHIFSNVNARVAFAELIHEDLVIPTLDLSIDVMTSLDPPEDRYKKDIFAWQFETLLPLVGATVHCPEKPEGIDLAFKFLDKMRYEKKSDQQPYTYFDRYEDTNFDNAVKELFQLHSKCLNRQQASE